MNNNLEAIVLSQKSHKAQKNNSMAKMFSCMDETT